MATSTFESLVSFEGSETERRPSDVPLSLRVL